MDSRTVLIGVDGLGWEVLSPMLDENRLSTLASIREDGVWADLESTHPPWTPCAWPSLRSGQNPGAHGVFDFFTRDGYEKRLVNRRDVDAPYLEDIAAKKGKSVISVNFPVTYPTPEYANGAVVPGYLAPERASWSPEGLREEFEEEYYEYTIYPKYGEEKNAVEEYVGVARSRRDAAVFLDERYDWDLLAVQFQITDSIFHDLEDPEQRFEILEAVDGFIEDIVNLVEEPTVFVVSDHGMGEYHWTFYVNTWLAAEGYCETTDGNPEYFRQKKTELKGKEPNEPSSSVFGAVTRTGIRAASKIGLRPRRAYAALERAGVARYVERILPTKALIAAQSETVDWENSDAFQILFNSCGIHVNKNGRDPEGIYDDEYETIRNEIATKLEALTDPDGNEVFTAVVRKEEVYNGAHLEDAPDLLLYPREYEYDISGSILGPFRRNEHMNHKPQGIIAATGPAVKDASLEEVSILDVAPTIAAAVGVPVDSRRDGVVLPIVDQQFEEMEWDKSPDTEASIGSTDASTVEERLANLGYLE